MTSCLALEETSFIGALGPSLGPHLKNSTEINHIFNCCLFMFKYLNTSQLLLVSNCLQCNVSRVAERGVKARSEVPLQGWTSNSFIDREVISLYLSFHSFPNGQNHGLTFLGQSWRSNELLQIFRSVASTQSMLQRWVYHHYHHCHHSNTKHLRYLPRLLHGNQTPWSGSASCSMAPKLFSASKNTRMVMCVFSANSHSRP